MNQRFFSKNLDVLAHSIKNASADLVYLAPSFKSNQNYSVLLAAQDGSRSAAEINAFEDTLHWD